MEGDFPVNFDVSHLRTPCYVIDMDLLRANCEILAKVKKKTGCSILLALKGFSGWSTFGLIRQYLDGVAVSSLHEAKLGRDEFGGEIHLTAAAYRDDEFEELTQICDHIIFNSFSQWDHFRNEFGAHLEQVECGLRLNPMHSEVKTAIYDPCGEGSRLGIRPECFEGRDLTGIDGFHFHTLCELNADSLKRTLDAVERHFSKYFDQIRWINFGGGHHITRPDYDVELICRLISDFKKKYSLDVILEPGEAVVLNAGYLVSSVLDVIDNGIEIAILDTSACAHMPDVLEMPYRPKVYDADHPGVLKHTFRLAGPTCLAGDVIGDYSFDRPIVKTDKIIFSDMAHYTMVKNTMFNGINLPDIALYSKSAGFQVVRSFDFSDFKSRLS